MWERCHILPPVSFAKPFGPQAAFFNDCFGAFIRLSL